MIVLLVIIYLAFISLGLPDSLLGSSWPSMYWSLGVDISSLGIVSMIVAMGTVISSLSSDKLIKRIGTIHVTIISVSMTAIALLGVSFTNSFVLLCFLAVPLGLGAGAVDSALNNFVALHYKAIHMNWLHAFWGIGATIGPMIVALFLRGNGAWNQGFQVVSIIQFCLVGILIFSVPLWKKVKINNTGAIENEKRSISLKEIFSVPQTKVSLIAFFSYCALEASVAVWASSYFVVAKGMREETAAMWLSLFFVGITVGRITSGILSIKIRQRYLVGLGQGLIGLGILFFLLPFLSELMLTGMILVGLGCAPIYPSLLHDTPNRVGKEYSSKMMGLQMASAYVGTTFMPLLFGVLAKNMSYKIFPYYIGLILILMITMVIIMYRKKKELHEFKNSNI